MAENESGVTAVIVTHNSDAWLSRCLSHLKANTPPPVRVLIVDNASAKPPTTDPDPELPSVEVIPTGQNLGFAGGANLGVQAATTDVIVLMNPDVLVRAGAFGALQDALNADPTVGIVGAHLLYPDEKTIQHAGGKISYPLALADHYGYRAEDRGQHDVLREVDYVTGALLAIRRSTLAEIGGFDEGFFPAYFEETDLCYRARQAGYKVLYVPEAQAIHHESATTGKETEAYFRFYHRNRLRFILKHYSDDQIVRDFWPAELERLPSLGSDVELDALASAYEDNLEVLLGTATFFANPSMVAPLSVSEPRLRLLRSLAEVARNRAGRVRLNLIRAEEAPPDPVRAEEVPPIRLCQNLEELAARSSIKEPRFRSPTPVVGAALVGLRRAWNWMSAKWYVRQVIQQQNAFNAQVVATASEVSARVGEATAQLAELRRELEHQAIRESQDAAELRRKLESWECVAVSAERATVGLTRDVALLELRLQRLEQRLEALSAQLDKSREADAPDSRASSLR